MLLYDPKILYACRCTFIHTQEKNKLELSIPVAPTGIFYSILFYYRSLYIHGFLSLTPYSEYFNSCAITLCDLLRIQR